MKPEAAGSNGIGPLVRQYVHQRNAVRQAGDAAAITAPAAPRSGDTVELSAAALARFEAWKAKHSTPAPDVTEPVADPVAPGTEPSGTEPPATEPPAIEPPATEPPPVTDPIAAALEPVIPPVTTAVDPDYALISQLAKTIDDAASISILV